MTHKPSNHSRQLAVQRRDDLADSLGCTSGGRNNVSVDTTTTTPVLVRGTIDSLLGGCGSMHGGHQTLNDTVLLMDDLGEEKGVKEDIQGGKREGGG